MPFTLFSRQPRGYAVGKSRVAVHVELRANCHPLSQNTPALRQHAGAVAPGGLVSRDDLFSVLPVNLPTWLRRQQRSSISWLQSPGNKHRDEVRRWIMHGARIRGRLLLHQYDHSSLGTTGRERHLYHIYLSLLICAGAGECIKPRSRQKLQVLYRTRGTNLGKWTWNFTSSLCVPVCIST